MRDDLGAPDRIGPVGIAPEGTRPLEALPGDGSPESLPYPTLPPIAPADGAPVQGPDAAPAPSTPATRPAAPPAPRKAPQPKKQDDTTFF